MKQEESFRNMRSLGEVKQQVHTFFCLRPNWGTSQKLRNPLRKERENVCFIEKATWKNS